MGSTTKYTPLDMSGYQEGQHGGIEVTGHHEGPEVVPGSSPPLDRKSTLLNPEPTNYGHYENDKQERGSYFGGDTGTMGTVGSVAPAYSSYSAQPHYMSTDGQEPGVASPDMQGQKQGRRYCGMRKAVFIALLAAIISLVCIAVILGAVLGTVLPKHKTQNPSSQNDTNSLGGSSGTPLQAMSKTGLATTLSGDGSGMLLSYFQAPDGRIIENTVTGTDWSLADHSQINNSVVTNQAEYGSPIAAISYPLNGTTWRQVFFVSSSGEIMTTKTSKTTGTTATGWSNPTPITTDVAAATSVGLAACWSTKIMNGIRVYYASQLGYIREVALTFGYNTWSDGEYFVDSDSASGVACATYNDNQDQFINVYMRNSTTNSVQQSWYNYASGDGWDSTDGPRSWRNETMARGSDIAVCNDNDQTEYIFYQLDGGMVTRGIVNPSWKYYEVYDNMQGATVGSKLAAAYVNQGALFMFQNSSSDSTMWVSDVNRNGISLQNLAVP